MPDSNTTHMEATKKHGFLGNVKWRAEEWEEIGGITWLGLYLLYARHGGNEDEEEEIRTEEAGADEEAASRAQASNEEGREACIHRR